jgi:hypothetical protein
MQKSFWSRVAAVAVALCTTTVLFQGVALLGHPTGEAGAILAAATTQHR